MTGLLLCGLGIAIAIKVKHLGLHPWDVLNVALFELFGLSIGTWSIISGLILLAFSLVVNRKYIGVGTFLNTILIGLFIDFFLWTGLLPSATHTWVDYLILILGIGIAGTGGGMYVAAGLGAGPRDGFMLYIADKTKLSVSHARILVESLVLIVGYLLGGPVFIMSLLYTFLLSPVFGRSLMVFKGLITSIEERRVPNSISS
ncbi:YczE/YyaS/YitT family protein [Peribacillus acanthi]|uniref:YczE/YyaS/YitT family protein n=1 Tax=Peribacillus acanthi TaxID=2171554 RepID=UPI000D3E1598|nr:hypothetical protein [Peribacillus acanthi]